MIICVAAHSMAAQRDLLCERRIGLGRRAQHQESGLDAKLVERVENGRRLSGSWTVVEGQHDFAGPQNDVAGAGHGKSATGNVARRKDLARQGLRQLRDGRGLDSCRRHPVRERRFGEPRLRADRLGTSAQQGAGNHKRKNKA